MSRLGLIVLVSFASLTSFAGLTACDPSGAGPSSQPVNECPVPTGAGTSHTGVSSAETWTAADSPHVIPSSLSVTAALTLEPCAVVRIAPGATVTVRSNGSITANGTATRPVLFEPRDAGRPWLQIRSLGGPIALTYTDLVGGGFQSNTAIDAAAALDVRGAELHVDHVLVKDSATQGILLREEGKFSATSNALTITGAKHFPMHVAANVAGSIPPGSYTGNAIDEITLEGNGASQVDRDTTFHDRGVPYRVGDAQLEGRLVVAAPVNQTNVVTLTIEPNVTVRFKKGGSVFVQYAQNTQPATGALVAVGTPDEPIVFTSAEATPAAGDWAGIHFNGTPDPKDKLDYVRVEYAGGAFPAANLVGSACKYEPNEVNLAAIRIFGEPGAPFVTNTKIVASAKHGIDRGWSGSSNVSFLGGGNDFGVVVKCKETQPGPSCSNPECP